MPSSRHARMMRTAISPRLAISSALDHRAIQRGLPLLEERAQAFLAFGGRRGGWRCAVGRERRARRPAERPPTSRISALAAAIASRPAVRSSRDVAVDRCVELGGRHDGVDEADLLARAPPRSARRSGTARARPTGRSSRATNGEMTAGRMPELHLGEPEHRVLVGDDDVADGGEAGAAAERRAVHAADERHGQRCRAREHPRQRASRRAGSRRPCSATVFAIHATSAPAQKALPAPDSTTTRSVAGGRRDRAGPRRQLGDHRRR